MQRARAVRMPPARASRHNSPLGADMVGKSRDCSADALFTQELMASSLDAADHFLSEGAVRPRLCHRLLRQWHAGRVRCGSELEL